MSKYKDRKIAICHYHAEDITRYVIIFSDDKWISAYDDSGSYLWTSGHDAMYKYQEISPQVLELLSTNINPLSDTDRYFAVTEKAKQRFVRHIPEHQVGAVMQHPVIRRAYSEYEVAFLEGYYSALKDMVVGELV